jgi:hypothetical protein
MKLMFYAADSFNQNLRSWNTAKVRDWTEFAVRTDAWTAPKPPGAPTT